MIEKTIQNCGKCGLCLNVCPVYKILKEEQASPRARLQLIKAFDNEDLHTSPLLKEIISKCLMCGSCAANCPSGINHYSKFMDMRTKMVQAHGDKAAIKSLIYLLAREQRLKFGAGLARAGQKILPDSFAKKYKLGNISLKNFPDINAVSFRRAVDEVILPEGENKGSIIYFTGCATNYLYDDTGFAAIGILKHLGYKIIIPRNQTCCSIPLLFHGAQDKAADNITQNINALKDFDAKAVLVDCSTCGHALKNEYPRFLNNRGENLQAALEIAPKVIDVLSFIDQHFDSLVFDPDLNEKMSVTYHAPCHTKNGFQSHTVIENLLKKLPHADYQRATDMEECCGGGGTFFYEYPDLSKKMMDKKIENARKVKASMWLTDCPVCRLNMAGHLEAKDNLQVIHPLTLIHSGLKKI